MPYFLYCFVAVNDGRSVVTEWMDEHVIAKIPIQDRVYYSCDRVTLGLMPSNGSICASEDLSYNGGHLDLYEAAHLVRQGANESDFDPDSHIRWRTISTPGEPDTWTGVESGPPHTYPDGWSLVALSYRWDDSWPENYWFVNYRFDDRLRRTRFRFRDARGVNHYYYAVPWAFRID